MGACLSANVVRELGARYSIKELGETFRVEDGVVLWRRHDLLLNASKQRRIHVSYYRQCGFNRRPGVVVFLHGSMADSRDHAAKARLVADKLRMDAVLVDFGGCGRSTGVTTWGVEEQEDVHCVMSYLADMRPQEPISFCAFSLGAAVALMCAGRYDNVACMVVDSSFARLPEAMVRFVDTRLHCKALSKPIVRWLMATVRACQGVDLEQVAPIEHVGDCHMPMLFLKVEGDDVIPPASAEQLKAATKGPAEVVTMVGSHTGVRTPEVVDLMLKFLDKHTSAWVRRHSVASSYCSVCSCSGSSDLSSSLCSYPSSTHSYPGSTHSYPGSTLSRQDSLSSDGWLPASHLVQQQQQRSQPISVPAGSAARQVQQRHLGMSPQQQQRSASSPGSCALCRVSLWQADCELPGVRRAAVDRPSSCPASAVSAGTSSAAVLPRGGNTAAGGSGSKGWLPTIKSQSDLEQQQQHLVDAEDDPVSEEDIFLDVAFSGSFVLPPAAAPWKVQCEPPTARSEPQCHQQAAAVDVVPHICPASAAAAGGSGACGTSPSKRSWVLLRGHLKQRKQQPQQQQQQQQQREEVEEDSVDGTVDVSFSGSFVIPPAAAFAHCSYKG